jgi:hypothetical protein
VSAVELQTAAPEVRAAGPVRHVKEPVEAVADRTEPSQHSEEC